MKFIGRKRELEVLEEAFQSPESGFIPVYGRRRVGKSEIILQFMKQKQGIYLVGKKARARIQLREFLQEAASLFEEPLLAAVLSDEKFLAGEVDTGYLARFLVSWPAGRAS